MLPGGGWPVKQAIARLGADKAEVDGPGIRCGRQCARPGKATDKVNVPNMTQVTGEHTKAQRENRVRTRASSVRNSGRGALVRRGEDPTETELRHGLIQLLHCHWPVWQTKGDA